MRKWLSSTSTSSVSRSQVSKLAADSETCSSPSAARQTCLASIDRTRLEMADGQPRQRTRGLGTKARWVGGGLRERSDGLLKAPPRQRGGSPPTSVPAPREAKDSTAQRAAARKLCSAPPILPGSIRCPAVVSAQPPSAPIGLRVMAGGSRRVGRPPRCRDGGEPVFARLTLVSGASYNPPDDDAPSAFGRRRVCVPLGVESHKSPRPDGEDRADS